MKRRISLLAGAVTLAGVLAFPATVAAHNRALVLLPSGDCVQVGSIKSVWVPARNNYLDLDPSDGPYPFDEYGASFAASQGNSALEKGACDFHPGR